MFFKSNRFKWSLIAAFNLLTCSILLLMSPNDEDNSDVLRSQMEWLGFGSPSPKINACVIVMARNIDLMKLTKTITDFERFFNRRHHYPIIVFNRDEFTSNFKKVIRKAAGRTLVEFAVIPKKEWSVPKRHSMKRVNLYLENNPFFSIGYHHMCRFFSGFFFRHPTTLKYDYFMRIDSDSNFFCPIGDDPFETLINNNKTFGFALGSNDAEYTMPTLWKSVRGWLNKTSHMYRPAVNNTLAFVSSDGGFSPSSDYCIFYNNFEVAAFSLFRSQAYLNFFSYLDRKGGFYYERWGDAPVHTYFVTHMLDRSKVHLFKNVPYGHYDYTNHHTWDKQCRYPQFSDCTLKWLNAGYN